VDYHWAADKDRKTHVSESDDVLEVHYDNRDTDPWERTIRFSRYEEEEHTVANINVKLIHRPGPTGKRQTQLDRNCGVSLGRAELLALRDWVERMLGHDHEREFNELKDRLRKRT